MHAVLISVSNNGQAASASDQHLYIAHSPVCFDCSLTENRTDHGTCTKKVIVVLTKALLSFSKVGGDEMQCLMVL